MKKGTICLMLILLSIAFSTYSVPSASAATSLHTWIDLTTGVNTGKSLTGHGTMDEGITLSIEINVNDSGYGGGINFYIMDEANYVKWTGNQSSVAYVAITSFVQATFNWTVPSTQIYYLVLYNGYTSDLTVHIRVISIEPVPNPPIITTQANPTIVVLILITVLPISIYVYSRRKA